MFPGDGGGGRGRTKQPCWVRKSQVMVGDRDEHVTDACCLDAYSPYHASCATALPLTLSSSYIDPSYTLSHLSPIYIPCSESDMDESQFMSVPPEARQDVGIQETVYPAPPQNKGSVPFHVLSLLFDRLSTERKHDKRRKLLEGWFHVCPIIDFHSSV
jgi:hypothetical protein